MHDLRHTYMLSQCRVVPLVHGVGEAEAGWYLVVGTTRSQDRRSGRGEISLKHHPSVKFGLALALNQKTISELFCHANLKISQ